MQDTLDERQRKIIEAKIATKKDELEFTGQTGPMILIVLGLAGVFMILFVVLVALIGVVLIIAGLIWSNSRAAADQINIYVCAAII